MPAADLLQALRKSPFAPFKIHVSDGVTFEIRHPELVMVGVGSAVVGIPSAGKRPPEIDHYEVVDLRHMTRLEEIAMASKAG